MNTDFVVDSFFGSAIQVYTGEYPSGAFIRLFKPTKKEVLILLDLQGNTVVPEQYAAYIKLESWYPTGVNSIYRAVLAEMHKDKELYTSWSSLAKIKQDFTLKVINLRHRWYARQHPGNNTLAVLTYKFSAPSEWYIHITQDLSVGWCGLGD